MLGLIGLALVLVLLATLVTGIVLWATSGSSRSGAMSCGRCGYAVHGLTQLNCPECGADLREAGIRPHGNPGRRMTGMFLTLVSLGIILLGCLSSLLFVSIPSPMGPIPTASPAAPAAAPSPNSSSQPSDLSNSSDGDGDNTNEADNNTQDPVEPL